MHERLKKNIYKSLNIQRNIEHVMFCIIYLDTSLKIIKLKKLNKY